ncbi:MAG: hypothetical protein HDQ88_11040 [Clostridia bacterium]|nr:hypothetical protein [Clostridia bacterium]
MKLVNKNPLESCMYGQIVRFYDPKTKDVKTGYVCESCMSLKSRTGVHVSTDKNDRHGVLTPIGWLFRTFGELIDAMQEQGDLLGTYLREIRTSDDLVRFALAHPISDGTDVDETARKAFKLKATQLIGTEFD